jgi:hypothetical protein
MDLCGMYFVDGKDALCGRPGGSSTERRVYVHVVQHLVQHLVQHRNSHVFWWCVVHLTTDAMPSERAILVQPPREIQSQGRSQLSLRSYQRSGH